MPKRKVKRGVRVEVKCPRGHPANSQRRCYNKDCPYQA